MNCRWVDLWPVPLLAPTLLSLRSAPLHVLVAMVERVTESEPGIGHGGIRCSVGHSNATGAGWLTQQCPLQHPQHPPCNPQELQAHALALRRGVERRVERVQTLEAAQPRKRLLVLGAAYDVYSLLHSVRWAGA